MLEKVDVLKCLNTKDVCDTRKLLQEYLQIELIKSNGQNLFYYETTFGYYKKIEKRKENKFLREFINCEQQFFVKSAQLAEIARIIIELPDKFIDFREVFNPNIINLKNGAYDLSTGKLLPHTQNLVFTDYINAEYMDDPELNLEYAENFYSFIQRAFPGDRGKLSRELLIEMIAFSICNVSRVKKSIWFLGRSNAGKSLLAELLKFIIPNHTSLTFPDFSDKFRLNMMTGKRLNVCDEVLMAKIKNLDVLKRLIAEQDIVVEHKGTQAEVVSIFAKLLFTANDLPSFAEFDAEAVVNRMLVLYFAHSIPQHEWDFELLDKMKEEVDVIVSLAIRELPKLIKNKFKFTEPEDSVQILQAYKEEQNSIALFIEEECELNPKEKIHYKEFLDAYSDFCKNNAIKPVADSIAKQVVAKINGIKVCRFRKNGRSLYGFIGLQIGKTLERMEPLVQESEDIAFESVELEEKQNEN